jgi:hypothetical protein
MLGKRRAVYIPDVYRNHGIYAYAKAVKEPFMRALMRKEGKSLPKDGSISMR